MIKALVRAVLFCGAVGIAHAETPPLYQQQVEAAQPDAKALQHSADLLRDHKDVAIQNKLLIQAFHKQDGELETSPATFCRNCHGPLPHAKKLRTRAFMNMHVRYIACETCHFRPKDQTFSFDWYDYASGKIVDGAGLFRSSHEIDNAKQRPNNPKIAPFLNGQPVFALKDGEFGKKIAQDWKNATPDDKVELRAKIHWPLEKKGPECDSCHTDQQALLNLPALGANDSETRSMQKHVIPQFFKHYEKDDQRITIRDMLR